MEGSGDVQSLLPITQQVEDSCLRGMKGENNFAKSLGLQFFPGSKQASKSARELLWSFQPQPR